MMHETTLIKDFTRGNITKQLLMFSIPLMLSNFLQIVYNMVDMMVVGRSVGSAGLAAVSSGGDIMNIGTTICLGFSSAGQILIAQHIGNGNSAGLQKTIGTMYGFLSLFSLVISITGILTVNLLLDAVNVPEEAYSDAYSYSTICFCGMFFIFGYNVNAAILRGMGDSKRPFVFIAIAAILNLILDIVFVVGFGFGPWGAALATVLGQALSFIASLIYLYHRRTSFGFDFKPHSFALDGPSLIALLKLGFPMALQHCVVVF
jgi:putative MATE family efflux protein